MKINLKAYSGNILLFLNTLIVFLLIFENELIIPQWLQPLGRMHPMLLHFVESKLLLPEKLVPNYLKIYLLFQPFQMVLILVILVSKTLVILPQKGLNFRLERIFLKMKKALIGTQISTLLLLKQKLKVWL